MSLEENCHSNNNKPQQPPVRDEENRRSEELTLAVEWMNNHGINTASTARESQGKRGGRKRQDIQSDSHTDGIATITQKHFKSH